MANTSWSSGYPTQNVTPKPTTATTTAWNPLPENQTQPTAPKPPAGWVGSTGLAPAALAVTPPTPAPTVAPETTNMVPTTPVPFTGNPAIETTTPIPPTPGVVPPSSGNTGIVPPAGPGASNPYTTQFGPGNDLQSTQFNPYANPRLQGTMGAVDAASAALQGPDRFQLAQQKWDQYAAATDPTYQAAIRSATQAAAANGRLGSGMLTTTYGDLGLQRSRDLDLARQGFLTDALGGTIQDRQNNLSALSGLENQQYGQQMNNLGFLQGERGYQTSQEQRAIDNALRQRLAEEDLQNAAFGRDQSYVDQLMRLGYMNDPSALYLGASGQVLGSADNYAGQVGDLLSAYLLNRGLPSASGG